MLTAQKGMDFLLEKGATPIGGFRGRSISLTTDTVDVTSSDDTDRWRQLLAGASVISLTVSGSGIVKDSAAQKTLVADLIAQTVDAYTVTVPGLGDFQGPFQVTSFQAQGEHSGEATYDITLESGGAITFTEAA